MLTSEEYDEFKNRLLAGMLDAAYNQAKAELDDDLECADKYKCIYNALSLYNTALAKQTTYTQEDIANIASYLTYIGNLNEVVPVSISDLTDIIINEDEGGGSSDWNDLINKPSTFPPSAHTHVDNDIIISLTGINQFQDRFSTSFTGNLQEFLEKLMIVYINPSFTLFSQNRGASYELGQILNGIVTFSWVIAQPSNVKNDSASGSITISETSPFVSNPTFNLYLTTGITRTISGDYTKIVPGTLTFTMNGVSSNNTSMTAPNTSITWKSAIWYGNDVDATVTVTEIEAFSRVLTNTKSTSVVIAGSGYKYIFIPDNISQSGISFYDPINQFAVDMNTPLNVTITNPFGVTLAGKLYRTVNSLGSSLTVNIL